MRSSIKLALGAACAACGIAGSLAFVAPLFASGASADVNHVLSTGQSLSVGVGGTPPLTTTQPYDNLMLEPGVMRGGRVSRRFLPLVEGDVIDGDGVPVETMSSAFANLVTALSPKRAHRILVSVHGESGTPYAGLKKGTRAYEHGMAQVRSAQELAIAAGRSYLVRAVTSVHGESDHIARNAAYDSDLAAWQRDYENARARSSPRCSTCPRLRSSSTPRSCRTPDRMASRTSTTARRHPRSRASRSPHPTR